MNYLAAIVLVAWIGAGWAAGPALGTANKVVVMDTGLDGIARDPIAEICKDFRLSASQAQAFLNSAAIVTHREIHDYYDTLPCYVHGTAEFHGYPATWKIWAGGTGVITLFSGETLYVVDERRRSEHH